MISLSTQNTVYIFVGPYGNVLFSLKINTPDEFVDELEIECLSLNPSRLITME